MSRDEVKCSSIILSIVDECIVEVFDDVSMFVSEGQFSVPWTVS